MAYRANARVIIWEFVTSPQLQSIDLPFSYPSSHHDVLESFSCGDWRLELPTRQPLTGPPQLPFAYIRCAAFQLTNNGHWIQSSYSTGNINGFENKRTQMKLQRRLVPEVVLEDINNMGLVGLTGDGCCSISPPVNFKARHPDPMPVLCQNNLG